MKESKLIIENIENSEARAKIVDEQQTEDIENIDEQIQSFIKKVLDKEGYVDFSQLEKVGHGGTHDIFIYPQNPKFVIKLSRDVLEKILNIKQVNLSLDAHQINDQYIEAENDKNEQLYRYFGQNHCLYERLMKQKIIIEKDGILEKIEGVILVQEASDVFKDPNRKDFSTGYTEQDPEIEKNKEIYDQMNKALLGKGEFDEKNFLEFNKKIKSIFRLIDSDKEFANCVKEFLLRFKSYFEASGRFIDLIGQENVLFYQEDGKWTFKLGSVIKGENKKMLEKAIDMLNENPEKINEDRRLRNQFMNQLTLIRLLNATGLKIGIGKIIDLELTDRQLENLDKIKFRN